MNNEQRVKLFYIHEKPQPYLNPDAGSFQFGDFPNIYSISNQY